MQVRRPRLYLNLYYLNQSKPSASFTKKLQTKQHVHGDKQIASTRMGKLRPLQSHLFLSTTDSWIALRLIISTT